MQYTQVITVECLTWPERHLLFVLKYFFAVTSCVVTHYFLPVIMSTSFFAEELLNNFAQQSGAWRHCLFFLSNTRNEYVMMYSLTVFEVSSVGRKWNHVYLRCAEEGVVL